MQLLINKAKKRKGVVGLLFVFAVMLIVAIPAAAGEPPSQEIEFEGASIGVSIPDMISTAFNFFGLFNNWVLLVAALIFVPVLAGFLIWIVKKAPRFGGK